MEAVADAFDRELVATDLTREHVERRLAAIRERVPEDAGDLDVDVDAAADWLLDTIDASRTPVSRDW